MSRLPRAVIYLGPASSSSSSNAAYRVRLPSGGDVYFGKRGAPDYTTTHDEALKKRYLEHWQRRRRHRDQSSPTHSSPRHSLDVA